MNEIVATIYYCFYNDENLFFKNNPKLTLIFASRAIKENFLVGSDKRLLEMGNRTKQFNEIFKKTDLKLWEHMKKFNISPEFYVSKWLILMLSQEFDLEEVLN